MQYACVVAGWSAQTQALGVDVKSVESVEEVMSLAAPCSSEPSAYPCAAGINTSSVVVFTEITMLDTMVGRDSGATLWIIRSARYTRQFHKKHGLQQ